MMQRPLLEPECLYHIYNHAVSSDRLFRSHDNYFYFLKRYQHFINPVADTYVYCLIPNHLHFLVEIKKEIKVPEGSRYNTGQFVSKQFSNLFSSYAQAFNKQQGRRGNLFISNFKRKQVDSDEYLTRLIRYIHFNPVTHGLARNIKSWEFSSFNILNSDAETFLAREKVFTWFGNRSEFQKFHELKPDNENYFGFE